MGGESCLVGWEVEGEGSVVYFWGLFGGVSVRCGVFGWDCSMEGRWDLWDGDGFELLIGPGVW